MSKKYTYEEVKYFLKNLGYELMSSEYENNKSKFILKDESGYYYLTNLNLVKAGNLSKFINNNPYTIQNIKLWLVLNNKNIILESVEYIKMQSKMKWRCTSEKCGELFETSLELILRGSGCPFCVGQKVGVLNCLATINPELTKEWHPTKNKGLTPCDVTNGSSKKIWWRCKDNSKHEWCCAVSMRTASGNKNPTGCPYCCGRLPSKDYNLLIKNPELCEEWDYLKNIKSPIQYTPNSNQVVWWICKNCGFNWEASINQRNGVLKTNCPKCSKSKGETEISNYLDLHNIDYIQQKTYNNLIGLKGGFLSYDFYIKNLNLLIEYQGEFHDGSTGGNTLINLKNQKKHDKIKKEYAIKNDIDLLEIWYYDFKNIKNILDKIFD